MTLHTLRIGLQKNFCMILMSSKINGMVFARFIFFLKFVKSKLSRRGHLSFFFYYLTIINLYLLYYLYVTELLLLTRYTFLLLLT